MAQKRRVWLKAVGTGEDPIADNWLEERQDLLSVVRFPAKPPASMKSRDLLVYYASGKKKMIAIASSKMAGGDCPMELAPGQERWALHSRSSAPRRAEGPARHRL